ncbi:hypothetical protein NQ317_011683 [Molorchus minor]|uniref:Uncharacterized protein n=1 Tax=Molorchus minor TaxID=1323400 RepID=A0ABQ9J120_9CUCU|nr:hypothetical protein NQ317_011683 [Molorchus minor]
MLDTIKDILGCRFTQDIRQTSHASLNFAALGMFADENPRFLSNLSSTENLNTVLANKSHILGAYIANKSY